MARSLTSDRRAALAALRAVQSKADAEVAALMASAGPFVSAAAATRAKRDADGVSRLGPLDVPLVMADVDRALALVFGHARGSSSPLADVVAKNAAAARLAPFAQAAELMAKSLPARLVAAMKEDANASD